MCRKWSHTKIWGKSFCCMKKNCYLCIQLKHSAMRKNFISMVIACLALVLFGSCATSEERVAEKARKVTSALNERRFTILVDRMYPLRGSSRSISYGYSVEVRNDSLLSHLPYFGRAYAIPYGGGKGLSFSAPIISYQEYQKKHNLRHIEIGLTNDEDTYLYTIEVFDNGKSSIDVQSRQREPISFSGDMEEER